MRLLFLLASTFAFGLGKPLVNPPFVSTLTPPPPPAAAAISPVLPRAPAISGVPQQCESACAAVGSQTPTGSAGDPTASTCTNTVFQGFKTCFECGYRLDPSAFSADQVKLKQEGIDLLAASCNQQGFPVQPVTLDTSSKSSALSTYQGSVKVAGAVGVAAVASILVL
jgi:hypothetical protein